MRVDSAGIVFLRRAEGCVLHMYPDSGGQPTIGIGHLLTRSERASGKILIDGHWICYRNGLTQDQADQLLAQDLDIAERSVSMLCEQQLTQPQFNALASFTFNVGTSAFMHSTLLKELNAGHYDAVPTQLRRWIYDNGRTVQGLINRRAAEAELWLAGAETS